MRERQASKTTVVRIGGLSVFIEYYSCECEPHDASEAWKKLADDCRNHTIIIALPSKPPNPCTTAITLLHTIEAKSRGSRVRNLPVLFLMELLGLRQTREVAESIKESKYAVITSLSKSCLIAAREVFREYSKIMEPVEPASCDLEEAWETTVRSVLEGRRLG